MTEVEAVGPPPDRRDHVDDPDLTTAAKRFKASDLPLSPDKKGAVDNLIHTIKKKGIYDQLRRQALAQFNDSPDKSAFIDSLNRIAEEEIERDPSYLSQHRSKAASLLQGVVDRSEVYKQVEASLTAFIANNQKLLEETARDIRRAEVGNEVAEQERKAGLKGEEGYAADAAKRQVELAKIRDQEEAKRRREEEKEALKLEAAKKLKELEALRLADEKRKEREARRAAALPRHGARKLGDANGESASMGDGGSSKLTAEAELEEAALSLLLKEGAELAAKNKGLGITDDANDRRNGSSGPKTSLNGAKSEGMGPKLSYSSTLQGLAPLKPPSFFRGGVDDRHSPRDSPLRRDRSRSPARYDSDRRGSSARDQRYSGFDGDSYRSPMTSRSEDRFQDEDYRRRRGSTRATSRDRSPRRRDRSNDRYSDSRSRDDHAEKSRNVSRLYAPDEKSSKNREYYDEHTGRARARIDEPPDNIDRYVPGKGTVTTSSREKDIERELKKHNSYDRDRSRDREDRRRRDRSSSRDRDYDRRRRRERSRGHSRDRDRYDDRDDRRSSYYDDRDRVRERDRRRDRYRSRTRSRSKSRDRKRDRYRDRSRGGHHDRSYSRSRRDRTRERDRRDRSPASPRDSPRARGKRGRSGSRDWRNGRSPSRTRDRDERKHRDRDRDRSRSRDRKGDP